MNKYLSLALISLFLFGQNALAGCGGCGYSTYYYPPKIVPIQVPYAYPILVPAFQFQYIPPTFIPSAIPVVPATTFPGYVGAYTPSVVAPQVGFGYGATQYGQQPQYPGQPQVGFNGQQPQYPGQPQVGFNGQQPPQPQQSNQDRIRELAKALLEEMNKQAGGDDSGPPPVPGLGQNSNPQQPNTSQPNTSQQQVQQLALTSLGRACYACHTGVGSKHDVQIFTQPGALNPNAPWKKIKYEIESGRMPPKDSQYRLTPEEKQYIYQWLRANGVN